jgi:hypothetical protein
MTSPLFHRQLNPLLILSLLLWPFTWLTRFSWGRSRHHEAFKPRLASLRSEADVTADWLTAFEVHLESTIQTRSPALSESESTSPSPTSSEPAIKAPVDT